MNPDTVRKCRSRSNNCQPSCSHRRLSHHLAMLASMLCISHEAYWKSLSAQNLWQSNLSSCPLQHASADQLSTQSVQTLPHLRCDAAASEKWK